MMLSQIRGVVCLWQSSDSKFQGLLVLEGSKGFNTGHLGHDVGRQSVQVV